MKQKQKNILFTVGSLAVGLATKSLVKFLWTKARGNPPPLNPAHAGVSMIEAIGWAVTLAVVTGLTRTFYRKKISEKYAIDV
jgi:hypothetical protein